MTLLQSESRKLQKGDAAPEFALKNVDGETYRPKYFAGKIMVIIFMCNHCPYVKAKMDEIKDIQEKYKDKDVVVIGINSNDPINYPEDDFAHMQALAKEKGYAFYLVDETQEIAKAYGATCTPDPFVFDKNHKLVYHGRINDAMSPEDTPTKHELQKALDKLIANEEIEEWFVPSRGCSIKWKE